jgi:hypothetical protein
MSAATSSPTAAVRPDGPASAFTTVLNAAVGGAAAQLDHQVSRWTEKLNRVASGAGDAVADAADKGLDDLADGGGAMQAAGASGLKAKLHGGGAFKAAVRGAWEAGSPAVRAAIVTALVATILLLLASPVLLLVFLLSLLVIAAVHRARRSAR